MLGSLADRLGLGCSRGVQAAAFAPPSQFASARTCVEASADDTTPAGAVEDQFSASTRRGASPFGRGQRSTRPDRRRERPDRGIQGDGRRDDRTRMSNCRSLTHAIVFAVSLAAVAASTLALNAAAATPANFSDGFETGNLSQWTKSTGVVDQQQVAYTGAWAARATATGAPAYAYKSFGSALSDIGYVGRFRVVSQGSATASLVRFRTSNVDPVLSILRRPDSKLEYYNEVTGATTVGPAVSAGAWHELRVHAVVNGASSLVEVWLDGNAAAAFTKADSLGTAPVARL